MNDDYEFDIGVNVLPPNLTHLNFDEGFNYAIGIDVLPHSLNSWILDVILIHLLVLMFYLKI